MDLNNTLFYMPLLVGIIFIIVAYITLKFPPKSINHLYGYRTKSSMKSQKAWDFAQVYSGKLMIYCGFGLVVLSVFGLLFHVSAAIGVLISLVFIFATVAILLIKTEKVLKQNFKNKD